MRALFVKQDHNSPSGLIGDAFAAAGYDVTDFTVVPGGRFGSPDVTVAFPDPAGYDAIVAFGAIWAVYDEAAIGTWIHDEIAFTRAAMAAGVPVLGICFGGQMLAAAAGGTVQRAPAPEIGWTVVDSLAPGLIDPGPWLEWHYDQFLLPDGVQPLATTVLPTGDRVNQAFTVGRSLGLQFHPEATEPVLSAWLAGGGAGELAGAGVDAGALLAQTRREAAGAAARTHELVRRFLSDVATRPVAAPTAASLEQGGRQRLAGSEPPADGQPGQDGDPERQLPGRPPPLAGDGVPVPRLAAQPGQDPPPRRPRPGEQAPHGLVGARGPGDTQLPHRPQHPEGKLAYRDQPDGSLPDGDDAPGQLPDRYHPGRHLADRHHSGREHAEGEDPVGPHANREHAWQLTIYRHHPQHRCPPAPAPRGPSRPRPHLPDIRAM